MFRLASEYASVKFRSLSGYRLASLHPAAAARRDGTALLPKWPQIKLPEEVAGKQGAVHHTPITSLESLTTGRRTRSDRSDTSQDSGCHTGTPTPQTSASPSLQTPIQEVPFPNHQDDNRLVDPPVGSGGEGLDNDIVACMPREVPSKSPSGGTPLPSSITARQYDDDEVAAGDDAWEGTDENGGGSVGKTDGISTEIRQFLDGRGTSVSELDGASFSRSSTAPQEMHRETKDMERADEADSDDATPSSAESGGERTVQLQNTELELSTTDAQQLSDELPIPMEADSCSPQRYTQSDGAQMPIKLSPGSNNTIRPQISSHQSGSKSPNRLPHIDKYDLQPVMSQKGNSYSSVKLGKGDFGEVVLMQSRLDGTLMAVKRLTKVWDQRRADEAFDRETQAMSAVSSSPAFPKFLGTVDHNSFAMEFIGNTEKRTSWSAYQMFRKRSRLMKSLDWLKVSIDVTKGLMDIHETGWAHNDLHSDNVMVCRDPENQSAAWEGKIIDLGYASRINNPPPPERLTAKQKQKCYNECAQLAPEIIEGTSCYNVQSDVYSLGQLFLDIAAESRQLSCLKALGKRCTNTAPHMRPDLDEVLAELTLMHYERLNKPRKTGVLATLFRSLKNRIRA